MASSMDRSEHVKHLNLTDFHISETHGFVLEDPLERLPDYFDSWNVLAKNMANMVNEGNFRQSVTEMPLLDHTKLEGYRQRRLAHLQLCMITTGYVWQEGKNHPRESLPSCVAVPLWGVSQDLGIKPVISHPGLFLANWQRIDRTRLPSLDNMRCLYSLPGGEGGQWYIVIFHRMEMDFVPALKSIVAGIGCIRSRHDDGLIASLNQIRETIGTMKDTFTHIQQRMTASVFFNELRTFLGGWGMTGSSLPDGLIYEGVSNIPIKCSGDTGAQTSTIHCLDAFLGIHHKEESHNFLLEMRNYMPPDHKRFIEELERGPSVHEFVTKSDNGELKKAYNECVDTFAKFRQYHLQVVAKYIVVMANREKKVTQPEHSEDDVIGKVGTGLMPFLKEIRAETAEKTIPL